ncbi:hypothetical protein [Bosea sp. 685]|uniref:hypothetical protein n=1 Tax=Bosea sp. 685 TaxID=3080057 RepID=UPI0028931DB6|nr:hypothetical protein [Bosea sp. 685]WNJ91111.1 hypothetical protein RMR04_02045 [Bosea sp. 685]
MGQKPALGGEQAGTEPRAEDGGKQAATIGTIERRAELGGEPAAPDPEAEALTPDDALALARENFRFSAMRNAYYHSARLRFYEAQHRALMFGIVLTGTAGVANIFTAYAGDRWFAGITALLATLDLVFDLRGKAQLHDSLKRRYFILLARLEERPEAGARQMAKWQSRIYSITAEEPVTYRAVDAVAHNEAIDTLGLDPDDKQALTKSQYRWRHFYTAQGVTFPYAREVASAGDSKP